MSTKLSILFLVILLSFGYVVAVDVTVGIPLEALNYAVNKVDDWFSCSRYDGVSKGCWSHDGGRDRRNLIAESCQKANFWSYTHFWGFTCWCLKC